MEVGKRQVNATRRHQPATKSHCEFRVITLLFGMPQLTRIAIHESQYPDRIRADLHRSLRERRVLHKYHYDSIKQTQRWLALHEAYSPFRKQSDVALLYESAARAAAQRVTSSIATVASLGCGGGKKDLLLLQQLQSASKQVAYMPSDVSSAMVLVALNTTFDAVAEEHRYPLVWDLAAVADWPRVMDALPLPSAPRIVTFYGMLPNFEPSILREFSSLLRPEDLLLLSANLAPGADYQRGVSSVLHLYDNAPTRAWLMVFLTDLGIEPSDGQMVFRIAEDPGTELLRIEAAFRFDQSRQILVDDSVYKFGRGDEIRLFFSYRHTCGRIQQLAAKHRLNVLEQWVSLSQEEGVFLLRRSQP
jgi:uncharacterized SAM-dependent methyltransferase